MPKIDPTTKLADSIQTLARASLSHADQMLVLKRDMDALMKRIAALEAQDNRVSGDFVLIYGNPVDGCELYGPYTSHEAACEEGERLQGDWWVDRINPPTTRRK